MFRSRSLVCLAAKSILVGLSSQTAMGPVGFNWPIGRKWSYTEDRSSPCGSADGVGDRTEFPLSKLDRETLPGIDPEQKIRSRPGTVP